MKVTNCKKIKKSPLTLTEDSNMKLDELQSTNEEISLNEHLENDALLDRSKCWLCQCPRNIQELDIINDCDDMDRNLITDILPWLCSNCERTMEEEDGKASRKGSDSSFLLNNSASFTDNPECQCDTCKDYRNSEAELKRQSIELLQLWVDLSDIVKQVYIIDRKNVDTFIQTYVSHLQGLVKRLCMHDAHLLYERLEKQGHEVIIDMKMQLLKRISPDRQSALGGLQFVLMLIQKYQQLCLSCNVLATFLSPLVEKHLHKFDMTWQLHDRHLFHNIIYSEPVVQSYLEHAIENVKQGLSNNSMVNHHKEFEKALDEHDKFVKDMNLVATEWKKCEKQIENYEEEQAALKYKQKMYKEDWEFFKSQRKLLAQMVPKTKSQPNLDHHNFDMQFQQILDGDTEGYLCPNCKEYRCTYDESSISHLITCGIISPEVAEESSLLNSVNMPIYSNLPSYLNVKPPSIRGSSEDDSCESEEPYIHNRQQNILASDDEDDDFHDAQQSHTADCCHHTPPFNLMNGSSVDCQINKTLSSQCLQSKFDCDLSRDYFSTTLTFEEDDVRSWEEANNTLMFYDKITIHQSPEKKLLNNAPERVRDNSYAQNDKSKDNLRICRVSGENINQNKDACVERCDDIIHRKRIKSDSSCLRLRMSDQLSLPSDYKRPEASTSQSKILRTPMSPTTLHEKHAPCNRRGASPHPCHQQQNRSLIDETERVKPMGCQSKINLHQDVSLSSSSSSGGSCASSCSAVHQDDGASTINSSHINGRSSSSSRDGKQHCECWHCEFFGHEAPTTIPVSRNFTETRDRLRMKLKEKKEKGCMKASRQQQLHSPCLQQKKPIITESKEVTVLTTQPLTKPWSDNSDKSVVSVEDMVRFINGNESKNEDVTKDRKNKKSRTNKKEKSTD